MTGRTLEEIEALAAEATPGPWWINPEFRADVHCQHGCIAEVIDFDAVHPDSFASEQQQLANAELIAALPDILAIAQGQREELITAKEPRFCEWVHDDEDPEHEEWSTECDQEHSFISGDPVRNMHKYCPYCGGEIQTTRL